MADLLLNGRHSLRHGWRALLFYLAASAAYPLLLWAAPALARAPRALYPLGLLGVLLACSWLFLTLEARPLTSLGLRPDRAWAAQFGAGLLLGCAVIAASAALACAAGGVRLMRNPGAGPGAALGGGALLYLVPALNEELAFRGYIFQRVERALGTWAGLALMAALFAAAHWSNPGMAGPTRMLASLNIFLAGALLGLAYLATRSLALPMGLHLGWNWTQGALLGFGVSGTRAEGWLMPVLTGRPAWLTGGAFGLEGSLPCTFVCLLGCGLLIRRIIRENVQIFSLHEMNDR